MLVVKYHTPEDAIIDRLIKTGQWLEQGKLDKDGAVADTKYLLNQYLDYMKTTEKTV